MPSLFGGVYRATDQDVSAILVAPMSAEDAYGILAKASGLTKVQVAARLKMIQLEGIVKADARLRKGIEQGAATSTGPIGEETPATPIQPRHAATGKFKKPQKSGVLLDTSAFRFFS